jgi:hypothetical protein
MLIAFPSVRAAPAQSPLWTLERPKQVTHESEDTGNQASYGPTRTGFPLARLPVQPPAEASKGRLIADFSDPASNSAEMEREMEIDASWGKKGESTAIAPRNDPLADCPMRRHTPRNSAETAARGAPDTATAGLGTREHYQLNAVSVTGMTEHI